MTLWMVGGGWWVVGELDTVGVALMRADFQQQSVCGHCPSNNETHRKALVSFSLTMVSTAVTISPMDSSSQDVEDTEVSTPLSPLQSGCQGRATPSGWLPFFKPILAVSFGTLLFVLGTTLSLLYFTQVGNVPYLLGPLFLAAGLMFLVTGLVWIPVLKESLEHHALIKVSHGKELQVEHKHH